MSLTEFMYQNRRKLKGLWNRGVQLGIRDREAVGRGNIHCGNVSLPLDIITTKHVIIPPHKTDLKEVCILQLSQLLDESSSFVAQINTRSLE